MDHNFDEIVDRKNTNSLKYDFMVERGKPEDILPLWVADMDFRTPDAVTEALIESAEHGIFGYSDTKENYFNAIYNWYKTRFDWEVEPSWLVKTPGVVYAIAVAIKAFTNEGDAVIIQQPVYHPFSNTIIDNNRKLVNNSLVYKDGKYTIDFNDFEQKIKENGVKLFVLCSPHNPVGRVWTQEELIRLGDICLKYGVIVVSDEIHGDFVYGGRKHFVFTSLKPEYIENTIICTAPSKTFNLAGLQVSNIFIANKEVRNKFKAEASKNGYSQLNTMGLVACQAAYEHGAQWVDDLNKYLEGNLSLIRSFLLEKLPEIKLVEPEGTYLVWLDFSGLGLSEKELDDLITHKAKLWLNSGAIFGKDGAGFQRVNIACPKAIIERALLQLEKAVHKNACS
ncbi:MAG TPA: pyridoxal phosphate-dependent aminotransferase [Epulopiscium sp.]|nr:pyridoxal phosphate-dependent aminotransferase [Candidatus Epulonipiscium sp.]